MRESRLTNGNQDCYKSDSTLAYSIGMAEVWDRKGSAPNVGQDRQTHYLFIPHHCRITARWVWRGVVARLVWWAVVQYHERAQYKAETFAFSRLYRHIRKPLMPIRYPLAFRGTARPSVCSALEA